MSVLTDAEIRQMWYTIYRLGAGKEEIKATGILPNTVERRAQFQAAEDALVASSLDVSTFVTHVSRATPRQVTTQAALAAGRIPADLIPMAEEFVEGASEPERVVNPRAINSWIDDNLPLFSAIGRTGDYKRVFVRALIDLRLEALP